MRLTFSFLFGILILTLCICSVVARKSRKPIGAAVAFLDASLVLPVIGNLLIVSSVSERIAHIGYYIFFIGMDVIMFALIRFTVKYCKGIGKGQKPPSFLYAILIVDAVQLALNPIFGHAFRTEEAMVDGMPYHRLIPMLGQTFHRIVDYGIFACVLLLFFISCINTPKIFIEKYAIILTSLFIGGIWQFFYIISRTPVDTSMIGFGLSGLLIFYFSLYYRPLKLLDRMLSDIVSEMTECLFVFDDNKNCIWANEEGCRFTEIEENHYEKVSEKLIEFFGKKILDSEIDEELLIARNNNDICYYKLEKNVFHDEKERLTGSYMRIRNVTEQKERMKREIYDATHDRLTGLYTQEYLYQRIEELLATSSEKDYYIIYVDVKNFKVVNDIFGVEFGDYAIKSIAGWLREVLSENCRYGRLVGDTFGILIPKNEFLPDIIEKQLAIFKVKNEKAEYPLLIHLGVYAIEPEDSDISVMFDRAHLSLSLIQEEYHTHISYYDNEIRQKLIWNQTISSELHEAINKRDVRPYLQPIADSDGNIVGAEALARWIHPEHGFLAPFRFIPVFEKNSMIVELDSYMWRCACETLARWKKEGLDLFISVNISPKDFYFLDVVAEIKKLVEEYGISPSSLRIEITETVMMNDSEKKMKLIQEFRDSGFIVEMDDFGSGYSSLNMLKDMPVDVLKIDMKFLGKSSDVDKAKTIVKNIITLSRELGISSLTEGVENEKQYIYLSEIGCELFQGFYFAKPMPVEEFEEMLNKKDQ